MAFTEEVQRGLSTADAPKSDSNWPSGLPWTADGSYTLAPPTISADCTQLRLESCLVRPRKGPLDAQMRTRVVHQLERQRDNGAWQLHSVEVNSAVDHPVRTDIPETRLPPRTMSAS